MAGKAATLQSGVRLADYLSTGLLARNRPDADWDDVMDAFSRIKKRIRTKR